MPKVVFTSHLERRVGCSSASVPGQTVREALDSVFAEHATARSYVLDDQGALRKHVAIFVGGTSIRDRIHLSDPVPDDGQIYVMQALSGG